MATSVTTDILRDLAAFQAENGCAVSIYLDLDRSSTPTISDVEAKFNAVLSEAEKAAEGHGGGRDCRAALREDIARIRGWWGEFDRDGALGVAVFASAADGFFRTVPLAEQVGDAVRIAGELYLTPLASRIGRGEGALVVVVSRERGTVYRLTGGRLVEVSDESEEVPGRHDQGGWSQARYQRHIENLVLEHLKNVGSDVVRRVRADGGNLTIVAVGPEEVRADFEAKLSHDARSALAGWTAAESHVGPAELLTLVRPLLDEAQGRREQAVVERWQEERGRGGRAAGGWKQTLDAASDARVEVLLLGEGAQRSAWRCPECGRASADGGKCPLDGTKLEAREDGSDLAIHQTLAGGGSVIRIGQGALAEADGIGALLRY
jgi:peptide chain release factor subunit 1